MKRLNALKRNQGITLIALVVTIVVLLILAGITINMLFGSDGIFKVAQDAANAWNEATINEQSSLENLADQIANLVNGQVGGGTGGGSDTPEELEPVDITTVTEIVQKEEGEKAKDTYGNVVVVPKGFKVVTSEATTVPEGIVIEDANGNQFVWIPVGTVYKDSTGTNTSTIKLGRYTFSTSDGTPTLQQAAFAGDNESNASQTYADEVTISSSYKELTTYREGTVDNDNRLDDLNATAKNLAGFVQSVQENGGYYIARYEASYGSGTADWKPLSKVSTGTPRTSSSTTLTQGMLWNCVTQLDASKVSQNMYANDSSVGVESDLINSYAWDTAIVFIKSMNEANSNYANANCDTTGNSSLMNTGETGDKVCNIYDMAANVSEWTTEYCTDTVISNALPCGNRGGNCYYSSNYTAYRNRGSAADSYNEIGFRVSLYVK